ncbi:MAG: hypothetical protein B7Z54_02360 [Sphingobacteriales bacterium 12-47-4]|nr:MAG: hypothetical protein B7Z54_02360 [Sphingobacteriales bacterium 12-47-4]
MQKLIFLVTFILLTSSSFAQSKFPKHVLSLNGFRNPSIGLEYQRSHLSIHAGYYITNFTSGVTTQFVKTGLSYWFLPVDKKEIPSSFYAGASFMRGLNQDYEDKNAIALETGFRWYVWKGLNLRLGVIVVGAEGQDPKTNPATSISYSFKFGGK